MAGLVRVHALLGDGKKRDVPQSKTVTPTKSKEGIRQAAWQCRQVLPTDCEKRFAVINEMVRIERKKSKRQLIYPGSPSQQNPNPSLTQDVLKLAKFGAKKNFTAVEKIVSGIKKKYKSYRAAHRSFGQLSWKRWHSICKPKKELHVNRSITKQEKVDIVGVWENEDVSITLPFKKFAKKKFMIITICEAYQKYIMMQKKKQVNKEGKKEVSRILSMSAFYKLKPKNIKTRRCIPMNQCICAPCANFALEREALLVHNIKGVSKKSSTAACQMLCPLPEESTEINAHRRECIYGDCKECTPSKIQERIKSLNPNTDWSKNVTWHRWKSVQKMVNGSLCSGFE